MGLMTYIGEQFHKPSGLGGKFVTFVMNIQNQQQYNGTETALGLCSSDIVLDIGFGNGYLLNRLAKHYNSRFFGIDISDDMLRTATVRNYRFIDDGRMMLSLADALNTGFADSFFDKVYTVNTVYFWQDLDAGLAEIWRILKPGGVFVNAVYTKEFLEQLPVTKYGYAKYTLEQFTEAGTRTGFTMDARTVVSKKAYCLMYQKHKTIIE
jgi:ubiquinone/menaquinone biosynthesis C-methylase UbiE